MPTTTNGPLNKRGREAARLIGESLPKAIGALDLVLCSSALRTRETAELALAGFSTAPPDRFTRTGSIWPTEATLMQRLRELDESGDVGHGDRPQSRACTSLRSPSPPPARPGSARSPTANFRPACAPASSIGTELGARSPARATALSITSPSNRWAARISRASASTARASLIVTGRRRSSASWSSRAASDGAAAKERSIRGTR